MSEQTMTKEDEAAVEEMNGRVASFNKEFVPLLGKYELGLGASAFLLPDGRVGAKLVIFDARKKAEQEKPAEPAIKEA